MSEGHRWLAAMTGCLLQKTTVICLERKLGDLEIGGDSDKGTQPRKAGGLADDRPAQTALNNSDYGSVLCESHYRLSFRRLDTQRPDTRTRRNIPRCSEDQRRRWTVFPEALTDALADPRVFLKIFIHMLSCYILVDICR